MAQELGRLRHEARLSARATAAEAQRLGFDSLDRSRIANLEAQRGRPLGVQELLGLCHVLKAWPADVITGRAPEGDADVGKWIYQELQVAQGLAVPRGGVTGWLSYQWAPWQDDEYDPEAIERLDAPSVDEVMGFLTLLAQRHGLRVSFEPMRDDRG